MTLMIATITMIDVLQGPEVDQWEDDNHDYYDDKYDTYDNHDHYDDHDD